MEELNKYLLQYILDNGIVKLTDAQTFISNVAVKLHTSEPQLSKVVTEINQNIKKQLFRIDRRICEATCVEYYVFCTDTMDDEPSDEESDDEEEEEPIKQVKQKCNKDSKAVEKEFFEQIVHEIMTTSNKLISNIPILNLTHRLTKGQMTKTRAEKKMEEYCEMGYLANENGSYCLGPRMISESLEKLRERYPKRMTKCCLCTDFVFYGKACSNCKKVLHKFCISKQLSRTNICPNCQEEWQETSEREYDDSDSD